MIHLKNILGEGKKEDASVEKAIVAMVDSMIKAGKKPREITKHLKSQVPYKITTNSIRKLINRKEIKPGEWLNEGRPMFQEKPNELAYLDFKKWAYKNRKSVKGILSKAVKDGRDPGTDIFLALRQVWLAWANKNAKEWSRIPNKGPQGKDFGRALAIMLKSDNLIIKKSGNTLIQLESATPENAPAYFKGLSKKEKDERERVIKKRSKMKSSDPDAYKPFKSDKGKKTKPSSSTLKFKKMFGELNEDEQQLFAEKLSAKIRKSLKSKAAKANAPMGALTTIYNKGLAAWRTGHRPGASQHAWAMGRVNSVLTGGKARKVDAAQWKQISKHRKKK
tara:strand:- start:1276 stop:2280 length:1005 start_codon:yes stop_codon:yes gene_type:complete